MLNRAKTYAYIFMIQTVLLFFLPPLSELGSKESIILYGVYGLFSLVAIGVFVFSEKKEISIPSIFMLGFFLICIVTGVWGMLTEGTPISDVVRGILPFAWYVYILFLPKLDMQYMKKIIITFSITALAFAIRIIVYYVYYVLGNAGKRVTFVLPSATAMITMVGMLIFVNYFLVGYKRVAMYIGIVITYMAIVLTATKSMIIAVVLGVSILIINQIFFSANLKKNIIKRTFVVILTLVVTTGVGMADNSISQRWLSGLHMISQMVQDDSENVGIASNQTSDDSIGNQTSDDSIGNQTSNNEIPLSDGSVSPRLEEFRVAVKNWKDSPILGKGMGYRWSSDNLGYASGIIYMHNLIFYLLLDTGLLGISFLCVLIVAIMNMWCKYVKRPEATEKEMFLLAFSIIIMAFVYGNFFAVFRNIEYTIACVFFVSLMIKLSQDTCNMSVKK